MFLFFLPISVFCRKGIPNGILKEWNLRDDLSWNKRNPGYLEWTSRSIRGGHEAGGRALGGRCAPPPSWAPRGSLELPPSPIYISTYPENIQEHHETLFPPPQPSVPVTSLLGACFGAPPKGESITEGFYINTIASPMMCESFTTDLRVHSY